MGLDGVSRGLRTPLFDSCARVFERVDERTYIPDMHLACLGPARNVIWRRRRGQRLPGRKRLCAHTIHAAKMWDGAMLEYGVLIQIISVVVFFIVAVVVAL